MGLGAVRSFRFIFLLCLWLSGCAGTTAPFETTSADWVSTNPSSAQRTNPAFHDPEDQASGTDLFPRKSKIPIDLPDGDLGPVERPPFPVGVDPHPEPCLVGLWLCLGRPVKELPESVTKECLEKYREAYQEAGGPDLPRRDPGECFVLSPEKDMEENSGNIQAHPNLRSDFSGSEFLDSSFLRKQQPSLDLSP